MIRHTINIGPYQYVADLYEDDDLKDNIKLKSFVIIRNFDLINDLICDKEIYIIEKSLYDKFLENESNDESNDIVFPITNNNVVSFSNNYSSFNSNIPKTNYTTILNNNFETANIKCNLIKLYHPHIKVDLKGIISIENYINHIHFYYLCKKYSDFEINSDTEFRLNNNIYSEYINIWFPSLKELFNASKINNLYNLYYKEELNTVEYIENPIFNLNDNQQNYHKANLIKIYPGISEDNLNNNDNITSPDLDKVINDVIYYNNSQYVPFVFFSKKYKIKEVINDDIEYNYFKKQYIDIKDNIFNKYSITINIFPYTKLDKENEYSNTFLYIYDDSLTIGNETYLFETKFKLSSKLGFTNHKLSVINKFIYPNYNNLQFSDIYKLFYNVTDEEYKSFLESQYGNYENEVEKINQITSLSDYDKLLLEHYTNTTFDNINNPLEKYKEMLINGLKEEFEEENNSDIKFIGYKLTIASDIKFKNIILIKNQNIHIDEINDNFKLELDDEFGFDLMHIFNDWNEKPDVLIAKIDFIDNYLGITISGNPVVITNEFFKYMINDTDAHAYSLLDLVDKNKQLKYMELFSIDDNDAKKLLDDYQGQLRTQINNINDDEIKNQLLNILDNNDFKTKYEKLTSKFNFINNINCSIIRNDEDSNTISKISKESSRIIYKPIFYRVQDLNNIVLESDVSTQNIGINLVNYMTKVESFKLIIDDYEYLEYGRNNIYVIFNINLSDLKSTNGRYQIYSNDNEYISSGDWSLI